MSENTCAALKYDNLFIDSKLYMGKTGDTINTEAGRADPGDAEPMEILSKDARYGRGEV